MAINEHFNSRPLDKYKMFKVISVRYTISYFFVKKIVGTQEKNIYIVYIYTGLYIRICMEYFNANFIF